MPRPRKNKTNESLNVKIIDNFHKKDQKKNKQGFYKSENGMYINDTRLVINCLSEMIIIGRLSEENEFEFLSDKDIEWCEKNNFSYEKYL